MRSPMMKKLFVLALVSSALALGCELIVDFDRTKIVGEEVAETGAADATPADSSTTTDSASDATNDSASDAGSDATDADVQDAADGG